MLGQRGFWTGLTDTDSLSCQREIDALESVIEVLPDYAPGYRSLCLAYAYAGSSVQAVRAATRYTELEPDDPDRGLLLASVYALAGEHDRALEVLEAAEPGKPASFWAEKLRGDILLAKGMCRRAAESYARFVRQAPYEAARCDGFFLIGLTRMEQGRYPEAKEAFEKSDYPGGPGSRVHLGRGLIYERQGRTDLARAEADRMELADADSAGTPPAWRHVLIGRVLMGEDRWKDAVQVLEQAAAETPFPDRFLCLIPLAESLQRAGHSETALRVLEHALEVNPAYAPARYWQARILEEEGLPDEGLVAYQTFLETWHDADPDLPMLVDAKRRMKRLLQ
jgi:tetratricopeptide (TPR) repeat protein